VTGTDPASLILDQLTAFAARQESVGLAWFCMGVFPKQAFCGVDGQNPKNTAVE
jgi:hypothetical protein